MKTGDNVRKRKDGRYEARFCKSRDENGKIIYGYCYGQTYEEAVEKREYQLQKLGTRNSKQMNLLILGAGVHGKDVYEIARSLHVFRKIDFLDDNPYEENKIGTWQDVIKWKEEYPIAIVAVADEKTRRKWTDKLVSLGYMIPTLVHPTAYVPEDAQIGMGTVICPRVTVSSGVSIGEHCIVTNGSIVPRKMSIPDWAYFEIDKWVYHEEEYVIPERREE